MQLGGGSGRLRRGRAPPCPSEGHSGAWCNTHTRAARASNNNVASSSAASAGCRLRVARVLPQRPHPLPRGSGISRVGKRVGGSSRLGHGADAVNAGSSGQGSGDSNFSQIEEFAFRHLDRLRTKSSSYEELVESLDGASNGVESLDPLGQGPNLDFAHDNDYNTITESGNKVLTSSLVYEALMLNSSGQTQKAYLKRRDLLRHYDLQPRDLRRVDPTLADTSPSLSVRDDAILVNMGGLRAIISAEKAIVFQPDSPYTKKFVEIVSPRLAASSGHASALPDLASSEIFKERPSDDKNLPFELECCEGAMMVTVGNLDYELDSVEERIGHLLKKLPAQVNTENLEELRRVKSLLVELESKSEQVVDLLVDFLEDEDDIAGMNLTGQLKQLDEKEQESREKKKQKRKREKEAKKREQAMMNDMVFTTDDLAGGAAQEDFVTVSMDDDEIESMLDEADKELEEVEDVIEYYLQRCTATHSEAETLLVGMRDMEESISVVLSSRRFEVNRLELALSIGSFAASLGAMISGIFGMNLRNKFELSVAAFYGTTFGILLLCFGVAFFIYRWTKFRKIL